MRTHWHPDGAFLDRRNREQLIAIAKDCGYADGVGSIGSFKKVELVNALIRHFANAETAADSTSAQQKAREWLPDAMRFPAIDRHAPVWEDEDEESLDGYSLTFTPAHSGRLNRLLAGFCISVPQSATAAQSDLLVDSDYLTNLTASQLNNRLHGMPMAASFSVVFSPRARQRTAEPMPAAIAKHSDIPE